MFVREIEVAECRRMLAGARFGRLACAHENQPYVVPVFFAVDGDYVYLFSMPGRKIEWMRNNPQVCLEIDNVKSWNDWTSIVVLGRYDELADTPDCHCERLRAHELLQRRPMWWQPASVAVANHDGSRDFTPVFFRISIERVTGHRAVPTPDEVASPTIPGDPRRRLDESALPAVEAHEQPRRDVAPKVSAQASTIATRRLWSLRQ